MTQPNSRFVYDLSISIVSFNTRDLLERAIRAALADTQGLNAEILVVDNASSDGSAAMVREKFRTVRLISNEVNRFFTAAHNQAIALSAGRYILILNSDVEIHRGTLPAMVKYLDAHPEAGLATTKLLFPAGSVQRNCAQFTSYTLMLLDYTFLGSVQRSQRQQIRRAIWYADWDRLTEREVDVIPGSFMLARREAIEATRGFDEQLRLYFGEDDLCQRIQRAGFRILYLPIGGATHPEGASVKQVRQLAKRIYFEDMIVYARKYFGFWRAGWLWLLTRPTLWGMSLKMVIQNDRRSPPGGM